MAKPNRSKWFKWKVGAIGLIGLILLFHEVKASPIYKQAYADASLQKEKPTAQQEKQDSVMKEWQQSGSSRSPESTKPSNRRHRQSASANWGDFLSSNGGSINSSPSDNSNSAPSARTGRS